MSILKLAVCLYTILSIAGIGPVMAQTYPVDTLTIITHSSPGGGSDVFLRELSRYLAPELGVNIVIRNITGGSGAAAIATLAKGPADGSVFYATTPTFIYTSLMSTPEFGYSDVDPLVNMFVDPEVVYTAADSPYHSLADVIDKARTSRGKWGAANPASLERQALEMLRMKSGVNAAVVSHEGGGDLMINVLNGTLDIGVGEIQELASQLQAGKLRLLATFSDQRLAQLPDLPTVKESGFDVSVRKFRGFAAPKGLPADIVTRWEQAIQKILANPEYRAAYTRDNLTADFIGQTDYRKFIETFGNDTAAFLRETGVIE